MRVHRHAQSNIYNDKCVRKEPFFSTAFLLKQIL